MENFHQAHFVATHRVHQVVDFVLGLSRTILGGEIAACGGPGLMLVRRGLWSRGRLDVLTHCRKRL